MQSRANVDLVAFNQLNSGDASRLREERDRLRLGGLRRRHTLLHRLDRSTWPALFNALQPRGRLPDACVYENAEDFEKLRPFLSKQEDAVLEALEKQRPPQKSASVVDVCSKIMWRVDPRLPTRLEQLDKVKRLTLTYHPSEEEEKMIIQSWKSSWDSKALGPISVKTQLKAALLSRQSSVSLETFLKSLLAMGLPKICVEK